MGTTTSSNFYKEFGGRLSLTERSNRSGVKIPLLVDTCILYLNRGFLKTPNLFNVPASRYLIRKSDEKEKLLLNDHEYVFRKKSIKLYMRLINAGRIKAVPFRSIKDPHILSGLLKSYFALLNPSLFTYFLYDNFIAVQKQTNMLAYIVTMRSLFSALPSTNQAVLLHVLQFFRNLIQEGRNTTNNHIIITTKNNNNNNINNNKKNGNMDNGKQGKKKHTDLNSNNDINTLDEIANEWGPILLRPPSKFHHGKGSMSKNNARESNNVKKMVMERKASIQCLKNCLQYFDAIFHKSNEEEFVRLVRENKKMGEKYNKHQSIIDAAHSDVHVSKHLRYQYIFAVANKKRLRQLFRRWKENAEMVLGKRVVYDRLRIAENANAELKKKVNMLKQALETASLHINVKKITHPLGASDVNINDLLEEKHY